MELLLKRESSRRRQQWVLIGLPLLMIAAGVVLLSRMIGQELKVANMKADFAANVSHAPIPNHPDPTER